MAAHLVVERRYTRQELAEAAAKELARVFGWRCQVVFLGPGRRPWCVAVPHDEVEATLAKHIETEVERLDAVRSGARGPCTGGRGLRAGVYLHPARTERRGVTFSLHCCYRPATMAAW